LPLHLHVVTHIMKNYKIHLVSDSTGETVDLVARACLVHFDKFKIEERTWCSVRSPTKVREVLNAIEDHRGFVLYTLVDTKIIRLLEQGCAELQVPCIPVLEPIVKAFEQYLGAEVHPKPGRQHVMDEEYFSRIDAMQFVLNHDDGQSTYDLDTADVVLLGVSRTSKTPTCIYLANRGVKAANVPIVPGCPLPEKIFSLDGPLIIGLYKDAKRLVEIRRQRLRLFGQDEDTDYINPGSVAKEINDARRLFTKYKWPIINVSRKSIEEIAAQILGLYRQHAD